MKILRDFKLEDLYDGIIVASKQNDRHLYELFPSQKMDINDVIVIQYRSIAFIHDDGSIEPKTDVGFWSTRLVDDLWCETDISRKLNPASRREDKLKELGI